MSQESNPTIEAKDADQPVSPEVTLINPGNNMQAGALRENEEQTSSQSQDPSLNANLETVNSEEKTPSLEQEDNSIGQETQGKEGVQSSLLYKPIAKKDNAPPIPTVKNNPSLRSPAYKGLFQTIPDLTTEKLDKNLITLQEVINRYYEKKEKGSQQQQQEYKPIASASVFSNIPTVPSGDKAIASDFAHLPWKVTSGMEVEKNSNLSSLTSKKSQDAAKGQMKPRKLIEAKDTLRREPPRGAGDTLGGPPKAMNLLAELRAGGETVAKYLNKGSSLLENVADDGDQIEIENQHETKIDDNVLLTEKKNSVRKEGVVVELQGNQEYPQFLLGYGGQEKPVKKGIRWLTDGSLPLLRDFESASRIFGVLRTSQEELGVNNCFLNLTYALLEMIQASENPRLWNSFKTMVSDMHNPDVEEYINYIFARDEGKSFHIGQIENATYDSLSELGRVPSHLTLFRLQHCKRQLARCLIVLFQRMLSHRYWSDSMSFKDEEIFSHHSQAQPTTTTNEENDPKNRKTKSQNRILTLSELIKEEEKASSILSSGKTQQFNKDNPSWFIRDPRQSLDPSKERQFWLNHYVFCTQRKEEEEEEEEEKKISEDGEDPSKSNIQKADAGTTNTNTTTQGQASTTDNKTITTAAGTSQKPSQDSKAGGGGAADLNRNIGRTTNNDRMVDEDEDEKLYVLESVASKSVPFKLLFPPRDMLNLEEVQQDLHTMNLLQEFCQQQQVSSRDLGWDSPTKDSTKEKQEPQQFYMSYLSCCAALGQIRLTQGLNQIKSIDPETGKVICQKSPTSDYFNLTGRSLVVNPDDNDNKENEGRLKRGVILKSIGVELLLNGKERGEFKPLEQEQDDFITANLSYYLVDRNFQPYVMIDREKNDLYQLNTGNLGVIPPSSIADMLSAGHSGSHSSIPKHMLMESLNLIDQIEKSDARLAASLVSQFFNHDGFLFCQPTLNLRNLQPDQRWKLNFKWECLEGSQNILACYILSAYLHALVNRSYGLHYSNLRKDSDAGNQVAKQLLKNLSTHFSST